MKRTPCRFVRAQDHIALGIANELTVASDLFRKGLHVFSNMGIQSPFDLVAHRDGILLRIEVTSGHLDADGRQVPGKTVPPRSMYDVLAVVYASGEIIYTPEIAVALAKKTGRHPKTSR